MAIPFLSVLKDIRPGASITVLAGSYVSDLLVRDESLDRLVVWEKSGGIRAEISALRRNRPKAGWDVCFVLPPSFSSALVGYASRAARRAGYDSELRKFLFTDALPAVEIKASHLSDAYIRLAEKVFGAPAAAPPIPVIVPPEDWKSIRDEKVATGDYIVIAAGATYGSAKLWPIEKYALAAGELSRMTGSAVVTVGTEGEGGALGIIGGEVEGDFINIAGRCTVEDLVAVLRGARLVIGNDSGPVHISAALGVPTVTVFGSTSPRWTAPRGKSSVVIAGSAECAPCFKRECPEGRAKCLESIAVSDLLEAARRLLEK